MVLTIISHTPHYQIERDIYSWGPTSRELNYFSKIFTEIYHIAPLHSGKATDVYVKYESPNIKFIPLKPAGGSKLINKIDVILKTVSNLSIIHRYCNKADWIHLRAPTNLGMYTLPYLTFISSKKRWVKYAGSWRKNDGSFFYRMQKKWLSNNYQNSFVTINGKWENQKKHCISFENPCLSENELKNAQKSYQNKNYDQELNICFVGHMETNKGAEKLINALKSDLSHLNFNKVYFIGDGSKRKFYFEKAKSISGTNIKFLGEIDKNQLFKIYEKCHLIILPSNSEGFPKVIAEAGAHGCVPVVSKVGSIIHYINSSNGYLLNQNNSNSIYNNLCLVNAARESLKFKAENIVELSNDFTFEKYIKNIHKFILKINFKKN